MEEAAGGGEGNGGGGVPKAGGAAAVGEKVDAIEGEFAGVLDAFVIGGDLAFAVGVEGAVGIFFDGLPAFWVGRVDDGDGAGGGVVIDAWRNSFEAGGDQDLDTAGVGDLCGEGGAGASAEEEIGDFGGWITGLDEGCHYRERRAVEEIFVGSDPGGGAGEGTPGFEGFGVVGEESGAVAGFDGEDEIAAVDAGFDESEFEGVEGNAARGIFVLVGQDSG